MEYEDVVRDVLSDSKLKTFVSENFRESMSDIGYSETLVNEFVDKIATLDPNEFIEAHKDELTRVQLHHFYDELFPQFVKACVMPEIPTNGSVLDLGCGRGTLVQLLKHRNTNSEIIGIDITSAPEWDKIATVGVKFQVVNEDGFLEFVKVAKPDSVVATWVFHHMEYEEQVRYLESLARILKSGATIVLLEDAYSEVIPAEYHSERHEALMQWSEVDRNRIVGAYDWFANKIFSMRTTMPVPFAYRTIEGWCELLEKVGLVVVKKRYLGFPDNQDVRAPRAVIVAKKL